MTPEQKSSLEVRSCASLLGFKLFRNNTGAFYDKRGQFIRFGLGNESKKFNALFKFGDYIGFNTITITPEMVGKQVAVFTNMEVKPNGDLAKTVRRAENQDDSREAGQKRAIDKVSDAGGIAGFVTNASDVNRLFNEYVRSLKL